jgi:hypothetical protein
MDTALTLFGLVSFFSLVFAWIGLPHAEESAPARELKPVQQSA